LEYANVTASCSFLWCLPEQGESLKEMYPLRVAGCEEATRGKPQYVLRGSPTAAAVLGGRVNHKPDFSERE
jgi:hypothetical protein